MGTKSADGAVWGAFCADAYALGAHWVYDGGKIDRAPFDWDGFNAPIMHYHHPKRAGDLTHYGDRMLWLFGHIADENDFDQDVYARHWFERMQTYGGYVDGAARQLMEQLTTKVRSAQSNDLAGAGGFAPLLYLYSEDIKALLKSVEELSTLTHASEEVLEAALYFAECGYLLLQGEPLELVLRYATCEYGSGVENAVKAGFDSIFRPTDAVIEYFGKSCGIGALPGVVHLLVKYEDDYRAAMEANVKAGGDSAARGQIAGTLMGAAFGKEVIPEKWCRMLHAHDEIAGLLARIDARNP